MADVSDVQTNDLKEILEGLEALSCKSLHCGKISKETANSISPYLGSCALLSRDYEHCVPCLTTRTWRPTIEIRP